MKAEDSPSGLVSGTPISSRHALDSGSEETRLSSLTFSLKNLGTDPISFLYLIFDFFLNMTCPIILKEIIRVLYLAQ